MYRKNPGEAIGQVMRITTQDLMVATNRHTGGIVYERLEHALAAILAAVQNPVSDTAPRQSGVDGGRERAVSDTQSCAQPAPESRAVSGTAPDLQPDALPPASAKGKPRPPGWWRRWLGG